MVEGHTHPEPPLPSTYLEETKTDCTGPVVAVYPYVEAEVAREGHLHHVGYLSPRDGVSSEETARMLLHREQGRVSACEQPRMWCCQDVYDFIMMFKMVSLSMKDQEGTIGGARRGRKRKQT